MKTIKINPEEKSFKNLEKIHYELKARENVVNFMNLNNMTHLEHYANIWKEYVNFIKEYELAKITFANECIFSNSELKNTKTWEVFFDIAEVKLYD